MSMLLHRDGNNTFIQYLANNKTNLYANEASVVWMLNGVFNSGCFLFALESVLSGDAAIR